jgi:multiple sugar transport system permease protein
MTAVPARVRKSLIYWLLLSPLLTMVLLPYAVMISTALKPPDELFEFPPRWLPRHIDFSGFVTIWAKIDFGHALLNSIYVSVGATLLTLVFAVPAAYAMARYRLPGNRSLNLFLLLSQMISPVVLIIGIFRMMSAGGLVDNLWSLVFANAGFSASFAVWMLQSYFKTIPKEIEEAALVDGASWFSSLWRVFLPLAAPAIGVSAIFTFIAAWTDFVLAFTLLRSQDKLTATMKVFYLVSGSYHVNWNEVMAATLVATLPITIIFVLLQNRIVGGLTVGAVK